MYFLRTITAGKILFEYPTTTLALPVIHILKALKLSTISIGLQEASSLRV
jgi:hypothetical protein